MRKKNPLKYNEQYVSYDVETLLTNIPVQETIEYNINEISKEKKLPKLCFKLIFKRLMQVNNRCSICAQFKLL